VGRHVQVRAVLLPVTVIVALLLAATAATYEVMRIHDRAVAAFAAEARDSSRSRPRADSPSQGSPTRPRPVPRLGAPARPTLPPMPRVTGRAGSTAKRSPGNTAKGSAGSTPKGSAGSTAKGSAARTELAQLTDLAALLRRSAAVRALLEATTRAVANCTLASGQGLPRLDRVIVSRSELLASVAAAAVTKIPDGSQLRAKFVSALRFSLAADGEFADWLRAIAGQACPVPTLSDSSFQAALSDSQLADAAKVEFLRQWNPLAARAGQPEFGVGQI
jgi:hypothetical protein